MKKIFIILSSIAILWGLTAIASANTTSCKNVYFANSITACVNIEKVGTDRRSLSSTLNGWSTSNLRCDMILPDNNLRSISSCNGEFFYDVQLLGRIKLWIRYNESAPTTRAGKPSSNSERTYPQWIYDFHNEGRSSDNLQDSTSANTNLNNFYLTTDDSTPSTSQYVDLTVKARDSDNYTLTDYTDTINFKVYYRPSGTSSWIQTTSSTYYTMNAEYTNGYDFLSSDNGIASLTNFIRFNRNNYDYKVRAYDANNTSIYKEITYNVGSSNSSSNGDLNNFYVSTDDVSPATYQYVDLNITARDSNNYTITDFSDKVRFNVYYKLPSSSNWTQTTSSSYYLMNSSYINGYDFWSYPTNGSANLSNFIEFKNSTYDYKVRVYDENTTSIYREITFNVASTNSNSNGDLNNFYVSTDDTTPSVFQYVNLNIVARDSNNYTITDFFDNVNFKVYYKLPSSSSWIQTTSSTYYTMNSSYVNGYDFLSANYGSANLTSFIKFNRNNYNYKVRVYDENDTSIYKEITFTVSSSNSNWSINGFTSSEMITVSGIYNGRNTMINNLKSKYSRLRNNTTRINRSNDFKAATKEIIDNASIKVYDNFGEFYTAFLDWYDYTVSIR